MCVYPYAVRATLLIHTKNCFTPVLQWGCVLCRQLQNREDRQCCVSTQPQVCPSCTCFNPLGSRSAHLTISLPLKLQQGPSCRLLPSWDGRTRIWGEWVCQMRGARVAGGATLSLACQVLCPAVVLTTEVCNPTLHFFCFPLCFDSDTPYNKIKYCYQPPCSASLGWSFSPTGGI